MRAKASLIALPRRAREGFTLAELLVSVFVLLLLILMFTQLMTSATAIARSDHKHIDTDTQARAALDRMAVDFGQMRAAVTRHQGRTPLTPQRKD